MHQAKLIVLAGLTLLIWQNVSAGQNLVADYWRNVPRQYGPRDPWDVGLVLRHQAGWGGHFFNCDCEENKRFSPYIHWEQRPTVCCPHGHCWDVKQQLNEVHQRIRTGACRQCEFCLTTCCTTSEPPIRSSCPGDCATGNCPTCGAARSADVNREFVAPEATMPEQTTGWLGQLYERSPPAGSR